VNRKKLCRLPPEVSKVKRKIPQRYNEERIYKKLRGFELWLELNEKVH
jgi:hypothetical protein